MGSSPKEKEGKDEGLRPIVEETGQSHRLLGEGKACLGGTILGHQLHRKGRGERQGEKDNPFLLDRKTRPQFNRILGFSNLNFLSSF